MKNRILENFSRWGNKIRGKLSHHPIVYALIGGIGIILFWRGIWHITDDLNISSALSALIGFVILVITGVFVSEFIGSKLIISGLIGEKEIEKKEEGEIQTEEMQLKSLQNTISRLEKKLDHIDEEIENK